VARAVDVPADAFFQGGGQVMFVYPFARPYVPYGPTDGAAVFDHVLARLYRTDGQLVPRANLFQGTHLSAGRRFPQHRLTPTYPLQGHHHVVLRV